MCPRRVRLPPPPRFFAATACLCGTCSKTCSKLCGRAVDRQHHDRARAPRDPQLRQLFTGPQPLGAAVVVVERVFDGLGVRDTGPDDRLPNGSRCRRQGDGFQPSSRPRIALRVRDRSRTILASMAPVQLRDTHGSAARQSADRRGRGWVHLGPARRPRRCRQWEVPDDVSRSFRARARASRSAPATTRARSGARSTCRC